MLSNNDCSLPISVAIVQPVHTPDELVGLYRARGFKITPQRQAVFSVLHDNPEHPTAEAVYEALTEAMPSLSLRTVYSVLTELAQMGEIRQLDLGTGAARFDPNVSDHHHVVCDRCGLVRDVHVDQPAVRPAAPVDGPSSDSAADAFRSDGTHIVFRGRCGACVTEPSTLTALVPE